MDSDLELVAEAGIGAVALLSEEVDRTGTQETARLLHERHLTVSSILSGVRVLHGSAEEFAEVMRARIQVARYIGAPVVLLTTGALGGRSITEADAEVIRRLQGVSPLAKDSNVTLGLEPVHPFLRTHSYVHTLDHAAEIVAEIPQAGIVFDVCHLYWDRRILPLIAEHTRSVVSVQLANLSPTGIEDRRWRRSALDAGVIPVEELIRSLEEAGFRGYYEYEVLGLADPGSCCSGLEAGRQWFATVGNRAGAKAEALQE
jgi:sugar phosphate isomerase/epimerase